ncbi:MAG: hypothetical protein M3N26_09495, partial [Pseudomonadota bacterium]|nr:hypothetical protein [Pseudomonadota bacterium]
HDGALGTVPVCAALSLVLVATLMTRQAMAPDPLGTGVQRTDAGYWVAMLTAGTLGTALGDGLADARGLPAAALIAAVAVGAASGLRARSLVGVVAGYWLLIVAIRTFGTNLGDLFAHRLSLEVSTPLTGAMLLLLLLVWRERRPEIAQTA